MTNYDDAALARAHALDELITSAESILGGGSHDYAAMLARVRQTELAAEEVRRAIIAEARADAITWQGIADALGVSRQAAHERYGRPL